MLHVHNPRRTPDGAKHSLAGFIAGAIVIGSIMIPAFLNKY